MVGPAWAPDRFASARRRILAGFDFAHTDLRLLARKVMVVESAFWIEPSALVLVFPPPQRSRVRASGEEYGHRLFVGREQATEQSST